MQDAIIVEKRSLFQKVLITFIVTLLFSTVGLYFGQFIPAVLMIPLAIIELIMVIGAFWVRKSKKVAYTFVYIFSLISGITTYPVVAHYVSTIGANAVLTAFATTLGIFIVMGIIGSVTKKDLSFLGSILLVSLLAIILMSVINIFLPLSSTGMFALSIIGTIVFSLYIVFDFNRMKQNQITEELVPYFALSLYLDFINLFLEILEIFGFIRKN